MTENQPDPGLLRLTRRVARQLNCSRSTAEQLIENGCVSVQGQVVQAPGARVSAQQNATGAQDAALPAPRPVTLLLHKPAGFAPSSAAPPDGPQASAPPHAPSHPAHDPPGPPPAPRRRGGAGARRPPRPPPRPGPKTPRARACCRATSCTWPA